MLVNHQCEVINVSYIRFSQNLVKSTTVHTERVHCLNEMHFFNKNNKNRAEIL